MPVQTKISASPRDTGISRQYGKIGIAAVAAAARYQANDKGSKPFKLKDSGDPTLEAKKLPRGTSPRRGFDRSGYYGGCSL